MDSGQVEGIHRLPPGLCSDSLICGNGDSVSLLRLCKSGARRMALIENYNSCECLAFPFCPAFTGSWGKSRPVECAHAYKSGWKLFPYVSAGLLVYKMHIKTWSDKGSEQPHAALGSLISLLKTWFEAQMCPVSFPTDFWSKCSFRSHDSRQLRTLQIQPLSAAPCYCLNQLPTSLPSGLSWALRKYLKKSLFLNLSSPAGTIPQQRSWIRWWPRRESTWKALLLEHLAGNPWFGLTLTVPDHKQ